MCNLASISLKQFVKTEKNPPQYDFQKLFEVTKVNSRFVFIKLRHNDRVTTTACDNYCGPTLPQNVDFTYNHHCIETSVHRFSSINLPFQVVTRNLNKIIDVNYYPVPEVCI